MGKFVNTRKIVGQRFNLREPKMADWQSCGYANRKKLKSLREYLFVV